VAVDSSRMARRSSSLTAMGLKIRQIDRILWQQQVRNSSFFDKVDRNWEAAWSQNLTPWETGTVSRPLQDEFERKQFQFPSNINRALIPGCGSGHDCQYLASQGFTEVIGLDLSPTAIKHCQATRQAPNLTFECADFFQYQNGKFDFIFDYLFFSALDPSMRGDWAQAMNNLLQPKTGILFTLIFPNVITADKTIGPPYHVDPSDYQVRVCCAVCVFVGFITHLLSLACLGTVGIQTCS
jgi:methyl halide transferase